MKRINPKQPSLNRAAATDVLGGKRIFFFCMFASSRLSHYELLKMSIPMIINTALLLIIRMWLPSPSAWYQAGSRFIFCCRKGSCQGWHSEISIWLLKCYHVSFVFPSLRWEDVCHLIAAEDHRWWFIGLGKLQAALC